mmetsp:Transcript_75770/g.245289  ORF Transcript_75770/g.245289 Transcript_75770/m.245289 type:complete len:293 (+) Transcript_75770:934-1812(+)
MLYLFLKLAFGFLLSSPLSNLLSALFSLLTCLLLGLPRVPTLGLVTRLVLGLLMRTMLRLLACPVDGILRRPLLGLFAFLGRGLLVCPPRSLVHAPLSLLARLAFGLLVCPLLGLLMCPLLSLLACPALGLLMLHALGLLGILAPLMLSILGMALSSHGIFQLTHAHEKRLLPPWWGLTHGSHELGQLLKNVIDNARCLLHLWVVLVLGFKPVLAQGRILPLGTDLRLDRSLLSGLICRNSEPGLLLGRPPCILLSSLLPCLLHGVLRLLLVAFPSSVLLTPQLRLFFSLLL